MKLRTLLVWIFLIPLAGFSTACSPASVHASAPGGAPLPIPVTAVTPSPQKILTMYPAWASRLVCESNAQYAQNPMPGKTIRFQTPIDINPNGNSQVLAAIKNYEAMTSGAVTFRVVNSDPTVGIVVVEGDALNREGQPGCGHITQEGDPKSGFTFGVKNDGTINTRLYIHLGSSACDPTHEGFQPQSIAEHELGHALGLGTHFAGFTGIEGLTLELLVSITALYRVPPGTDMTNLCAK